MPGSLETATDSVEQTFDLSIGRPATVLAWDRRRPAEPCTNYSGAGARQVVVAAIKLGFRDKSNSLDRRLNFGGKFRCDFFNPVGFRGVGRRLLQELLLSCCLGRERASRHQPAAGKTIWHGASP